MFTQEAAHLVDQLTAEDELLVNTLQMKLVEMLRKVETTEN